jgi:hypothetical protein
MKIQIYTVETPEEAQAIVDLGVDHIGMTPANRGLPGGGFRKDMERVQQFVAAAWGALDDDR